MSRTILGIAAANVAAPCLAMLFLSLIVITPEHIERDGWSTLIELPLTAILFGLVGLFFYGLPVFIGSYVLASLAGYYDRETQPVAVLGGLLLGLSAALLLPNEHVHPNTFSNAVKLVAPFALAGAVSGWIYWRIAITGAIDGFPY